MRLWRNIETGRVYLSAGGRYSGILLYVLLLSIFFIGTTPLITATETPEADPGGGAADAVQPSPIMGTVIFGIFLSGMLMLSIVLLNLKRRRLRARLKGIPDISWENESWEPPKIQIAAFRRFNKIASLNIIEVMTLLGFPVRNLLAAIVATLMQKGIVKKTPGNENRLELEGSQAAADNPYEKIVMTGISCDNCISDNTAAFLFYEIADRLQTKMWDCDIEASRLHYENELKILLSEDGTADEPTTCASKAFPEDSFFKHRRNYLRIWAINSGATSNGSPPANGFETIYNQLANTFSEIRGIPKGALTSHAAVADACHTACYVHTACHDACHSACHSACHDACHSACVARGQ